MKIALLTDGISPYVLGGMQRHSFYLAKYFARQKVYVDLFHFNQSKLDIDKLECFTEEEKIFINPIVLDFPQALHFPGHYIYESYLYSKNIFELIKPQLSGYDFIYTKGFSGWKLINEKAKGLKCPPIGINVHGYEMFQEAPNYKSRPGLLLLRFFIKPLLTKSDKIFSYGGKITTLLTNDVKIPYSKIIVVPGGIEESWINTNYKRANKLIRFVFLGRAERRKGIEELNEALNRIKNSVDFEFTFIGPIPEHKQIKDPKIRYLGEIRDVEVLKEQLFQNDVLVCPSYSEGMPNVILEAMANQLAIVATDVGAVSMMVKDQNGWLLPKVNVHVLENTLTNVCRLDAVSLGSKQLKSLEIVKEQFLWDRIINSLIEKIGDALIT